MTLILIVISAGCYAQNGLISDITLVRQVQIDTVIHKKEARNYLYAQEKNPVVKYNPVHMVFGGLLYLYQNTLSYQFSSNCLYNPSCSDFGKQAIQEFGLLKGIFLSADRVMRCNRIAGTGIQPVRIENNKVTDPVEFYRVHR